MENLPLHQKIINYLNFYIENKIDLKVYAQYNRLPIYKEDGSLDKGWMGNIIEHILNLSKNNSSGSDYENLEIKTVPILVNKQKVKETTCLAVLNPSEIIHNEFEKSKLYKKIKNTLFVLIDVSGSSPTIWSTYYMSLEKLPELKSKMEYDYNIISYHVLDNIQNEMPLDKNFTGYLGETIQPRPKTGKKGEYTWAFYLKSHVLNELIFNKLKKRKTL